MGHHDAEPLEPRFYDRALAKSYLSPADEWALGILSKTGRDEFRDVTPEEYESAYAAGLHRLVVSGLVEAEVSITLERVDCSVEFTFLASGDWGKTARDWVNKYLRSRGWQGKTEARMYEYRRIILTAYGEKARKALLSGYSGTVATHINLDPSWLGVPVVWRVRKKSERDKSKGGWQWFKSLLVAIQVNNDNRTYVNKVTPKTAEQDDNRYVASELSPELAAAVERNTKAVDRNTAAVENTAQPSTDLPGGDANQRMMDALQDDPRRREWTRKEWSSFLKVNERTVSRLQMWKTVQAAKEAARLKPRSAVRDDMT